MKQPYLECGKAVSTHGIRGTLRFECWCDTPETMARLHTLYRKGSDGTMIPMKVKAASVQKGMVLITFADLATLEEAIPFKGTVFFAARSDFKLPEDTHFVTDLIGLDVIDEESGEKYGKLSEVITPGGREVYVVEDINGGSFMIPVVNEFIRRVIDEGPESGIYVRLIDGMRE